MSENDREQVLRRLHGLRELESNVAFRELLAPLLEAKVKEHLRGLSDPSKSAEERSGHVLAFQLAAELGGCAALDRKSWLAAQIEAFEGEWEKLTPGAKARSADEA